MTKQREYLCQNKSKKLCNKKFITNLNNINQQWQIIYIYFFINN